MVAPSIVTCVYSCGTGAWGKFPPLLPDSREGDVKELDSLMYQTVMPGVMPGVISPRAYYCPTLSYCMRVRCFGWGGARRWDY